LLPSRGPPRFATWAPKSGAPLEEYPNMRSHEFVTETSQESQILNLIASRAARYLLANKTSNDTVWQMLTSPIGGPTKYRGTVMLRNLGISATDNAQINWLINNIEVAAFDKLYQDSIGTLGGYSSADKVIRVYLPAVQAAMQHYKMSAQDLVASILVHELQHALDDLKSKGRALAHNPADNLDSAVAYQQYLSLPKEINARFAQALLDIAEYATRMVSRDQLTVAIQVAFNNHQLTRELFGNNVAQYRRLLSRTYKFFDAYIDAPYAFRPKPLAARAWSWITRQPTDTISR
jgi:hypothetical protein